ncbi:helix-turn-helix domain-containing protein [Thiothrix winogradskyi]|uniref:DNA binding HTH domain-containing protein n=1 Tax=Thiothrix winogradskyi TaxID=96472 RepID=A0ABY3T3W7_9GAMM|nr:helix-turn-helix domain-containing protein [Thiothrix winogradskyi]UJS26251.1 hypothetical protein L2Y54_09490 [Thiothrix winogradskyi]
MNQESLQALLRAVRIAVQDELATLPMEGTEDARRSRIWYDVQKAVYGEMAETAIATHDGNQFKAAISLGINRNTLRTWKQSQS